MSKLSIIKAVTSLWFGSLSSAILAFLLQVIIARKLPVHDYGVFSAALGTVNLVAPMAGFGIAALWLKLFGQEGWMAIRWIKPSLKFTFFSTLGVLMTLLLWGRYGPHDTTSTNLIAILSISIFGLVSIELLTAKLQLEERYSQIVLWQVLPQLTRLVGCGFIVFFLNHNVYMIAICFSFISIVVALTGLYPLSRLSKGEFNLIGHGIKINKNHCHGENKISLSDVISQAWVFGLGGMFYIIWSQSYVVIIKYLIDDSTAGYFNIAILIITAICMLPTVIYTKFLLPKIHRWSNLEPEKLKKVYYVGNKLMLSLGLIAMLSVWLFSKWAIEILFSEQYGRAADILFWLSIILPIRFVGHNIGAMLVAKNYMLSKLKVMTVVVLSNMVMNLILIPYYGVMGAIITAIICEGILVLGYYVLVNKIYLSRNWQVDI